MSTIPRWQYDESCQVGVDYSIPENAEAYDNRHRRFRDIDAENVRVAGLINLQPADTLLELGAGTGFFAIYAAQRCARVIAADISPAMLACIERKASEAGLSNIECRHGGFLTYEHDEEPVDVLVSQVALHHIPDFWKQVALQRLFAMLKPGGRFYLGDVVFSFDMDNHAAFFNAAFAGMAEKVDDEFMRDFEEHVRAEYSTMDWVMEGLLTRAGFEIDDAVYRDGLLAEYVCTKPTTSGAGRVTR